MMTRNFMIVCIAMLTMGTMQAQAQGLGGLLKKGKKALEKVNSVLGGTTESNQQDSKAAIMKTGGSDIVLPNGGSLRNPIPQVVDVQLVGVYGKSTSLNYGTVQLVFKVKMIANKSNIRFGVNSEFPGLMIDQDGNTYKTESTAGWYDYPVTEGVYMKLPVTKTLFVDVKKSAKTIQQLQIGISASYDETGLIILRNIPIQWDVEP
ncbi:MAG: hypothetical protein SPL43_06040 [Prevotella sp.]|nr:hypothetical protein [Prevotella sp.]